MPMPFTMNTGRYARTIDVSKRVRWDIDGDVIRGRRFDRGRAFLPPGLSLVDELEFLDPAERRLLSQVQGRTYAAMFALVERFIAAKAMELGLAHSFGDQVAMEALVRMTDEELKHQELFRRLEAMLAADMPAGWRLTADPDALGAGVLRAADWAVLALTLDIELFSQAHYRASIEPHGGLCELWKDVFLFHWREESQHAVIDELEFLRADALLSDAARDAAVDDLIALLLAVDAVVREQAAADAEYFHRIAGRPFPLDQRERIDRTLLKAYRWQYVVSGVLEPRFNKTLFACVDAAQAERIRAALAPLMHAVPLRRPAGLLSLAA